MKEILLRPQIPYFNYVDVDVLDFPKGPDGEPRKRMTITVDYGKFDVDQLKKQGMDLKAAMEYYRDWIYQLVRVRLLDEWTAVGGLDETLSIVRSHIEGMFEDGAH